MSTEKYAIIQTGGKQYRVVQDDIIDVELLDAEPGSNVEFEVLFLQDGKQARIGAPTISGHTVKGELLCMTAGPKITSIKYKKRKHQRRKWGHRQKYSQVRITDIGFGESKPKVKKEPKAKKTVAAATKTTKEDKGE